ncbi:MAG: hypothetical protein A2Z29_09405 [Chloroflexi bacterium RBG_16_56_11]|nr:MAG: hypothetical protein A2Z29_09405 [Chloroflexi bacterium RBG_16_56_11]
MRLSCGIILLIGSLVGIVLSFISKIVINSPLTTFNGMEISIVLGLFFGLTFIGSIYILFSNT